MEELKNCRFTDWDQEDNDRYGTFTECKEIFDKAVKDDPEGRFSIYDMDLDVGILFNENCPVYSSGKKS